MLCDFYDNESESIVNFETFFGPKRNIVEKCIIIFSKIIYEHLLSAYKCEKIAVIGECNGNLDIWAFEYAGEKIAFYLSPIGSAQAGGTVAEVNHVTGAYKFVMFGSCGSLDEKATHGKYIVPTEAYRGEGLSYYYAEARDYIDIKNADFLGTVFSELGIPLVKGRVWTTDSMLRETVNLVNKRKSEGCIAVDMEIAGVQAVCDFFGYELYDFLVAGDVVSEGNYEIGNLDSANHDPDKLRIALKIAERI